MLYLSTNRLDQAVADLDRAIELERENPEYYFQRVSVNAVQGRRDPAIADFRQVLALDPSHEKAAAALQRLGVEP